MTNIDMLCFGLQGTDIKDVMQQLLPVEEDKGKPQPTANKAASSQQAKQGNAKEAKPSTPAQKRDQASKGASKSADKRQQDRRVSQDSSRSQQVNTCKNALFHLRCVCCTSSCYCISGCSSKLSLPDPLLSVLDHLCCEESLCNI